MLSVWSHNSSSSAEPDKSTYLLPRGAVVRIKWDTSYIVPSMSYVFGKCELSLLLCIWAIFPCPLWPKFCYGVSSSYDENVLFICVTRSSFWHLRIQYSRNGEEEPHTLLQCPEWYHLHELSLYFPKWSSVPPCRHPALLACTHVSLQLKWVSQRDEMFLSALTQVNWSPVFERRERE